MFITLYTVFILLQPKQEFIIRRCVCHVVYFDEEGNYYPDFLSGGCIYK